MAITVRRESGPAMQIALAVAHNQLCAQTALVGALFHGDKLALTTTDAFISTSAAVLAVTAAAATDLPTSITMVNNIQGVFQAMVKDAISTNPVSAGSHKIPDIVNNALVATATDLATSITLANAMKTQFNAHCSQAGVHFNNDGTNTVATANATVLADLITLINVIKTNINAHIASGPLNHMVNVIGA